MFLFFALIGCDPMTVKFSDDTAAPEAVDCADGSGDDCDGDGYLVRDGDCDDFASTVHPDAEEDCSDGVDNDCNGAADAADGSCSGSADADADGYDASVDCDDADATVNPGAAEICDGLDQDCDGAADDGILSTIQYADADGDGYGDVTDSVAECDRVAGYVMDATDCDDADAGINPAAAEVCNDVDENCDPTDDDYPSVWFPDVDGDGYGDETAPTEACDQPTGYVADGSDCNDADRVVNPGAVETCGDGVDNNCDFADDTTGSTWYADADLDGYGDVAATTAACDQPSGYVATSTDCADGDATVNPGAAESCNSVDDDCDGAIDDGFDADGDGAYDADSCSYGTDCNDAASSVYPGAAEIYNAADDDCDGSVDEDFDLDLDGYVDAVYGGDDCDDLDATVNPGAAEVCGDGIDNNCNAADDASGATWYADADADGYGDALTSTVSCTAPSGYVTNATDCDDAASGVNPRATETCNGLDDDCDGSADESGSTGSSVWYPDADGDGYGASSPYVRACDAPAGYVSDGSDCDDGDATLSPEDTDADGDSLCDGDCDNADASLNLDDGDGDGYSTCDGECNDHERTYHPGAAEICDGDDNDCDGTVDDGLATSTWYLDMDGDGYGDGTVPITDCSRPFGTVSDGTDCDDGDSRVSPGDAETCDGEDDDCDGTADNGFDADADGAYDAASCSYGTDCDDADASVVPGATEACDGIDNDCDDLTDEDFDADGDGYASSAACSYGTDCDDAEVAVSPGGKEISLTSTAIDDLCSDGLDNDCDGFADALDPWDCDDEDADGIENGIDVFVSMDSDADGLDDTLCLVADERLSMATPWDAYDAVIQGDGWGGFSVLDASYTEPLVGWADSDGDGANDVQAWCNTFAGSGLATGAWNWRFVSAVAADESSAATSRCSTASDATTWEPMDVTDVCDLTGDDWCRAGYAAFDGCGEYIGTVARVRYSASTDSIEPY